MIKTGSNGNSRTALNSTIKCYLHKLASNSLFIETDNINLLSVLVRFNSDFTYLVPLTQFNYYYYDKLIG